MNIRIIKIPTENQGGGLLMEPIYYTYQQFFTHTKGIAYILMVVALIGIAFFWRFLSGGDDEEKLE